MYSIRVRPRAPWGEAGRIDCRSSALIPVRWSVESGRFPLSGALQEQAHGAVAPHQPSRGGARRRCLAQPAPGGEGRL